MEPESESQRVTRRRLKGILGEALVKEYFEQAGWSVIPAGVETVGSHLLRHHGVAAGDLQALPDFLLVKTAGSPVNPATHSLGQAFYVEVKTRREWPGRMNMRRYLMFGSVLLVWVGPDGLKGVWLGPPEHGVKGTHAPNPEAVAARDMVELPYVGVISQRHSIDGAEQNVVREIFHQMARQIAML